MYFYALDPLDKYCSRRENSHHSHHPHHNNRINSSKDTITTSSNNNRSKNHPHHHHHRVASSSGSGGKKRRRHRTAFTPTQLLGLENSFERGHYLVGDERKQLAAFLRLSETQIKVHTDIYKNYFFKQGMVYTMLLKQYELFKNIEF